MRSTSSQPGHGPARVEDWVLTPHPGEAARLLGRSIAEVQADRLAALAALCQQRGGTVVLKGATSLVGHEGEVPRLCNRGNPGMAVPGMGDVLTGAIAGLLAQSTHGSATPPALLFMRMRWPVIAARALECEACWHWKSRRNCAPCWRSCLERQFLAG